MMNIDDALEDAKTFLEDLHNENGYEELGEIPWFYHDALKYVIKYAETMRPTPTDHDSKAEFESWDAFFAERRRAAGLE
jgi:hypothetical protein